MIVFGAPLWLLAGGLAALVPLALHLIRRRPADRAPLPTARFLSDDPRTSIRVSRPTDLLLLALRMALLLLFGAALARPAWLPSPAGTSELVLLDRGAALPSEAWREAVGAARRTLLPDGGPARGALVLFDTATRRVDAGRLNAAFFDSLSQAGPGGAGSRYGAALRAIPPAARELRGADSLRATLISPLRWSAWEPGTAALRRTAWPGAVRLIDVALPAPAPLTPDSAPRVAAVIAPAGEGRYATAALAATGWDVQPATVSGAGVYLVMGSVDASSAASLREAARSGATLVLAGGDALRALGDDAPLTAGAPDAAAGDLRFDDGTSLDGFTGRIHVTPSDSARILAAWRDGRPAAAARRSGDGCIVAFAAALEDGSASLSAAFPRAVDRLARGCDSAPATADAPLDAGARAVLAGADRPAAVSAARAEGAGGGAPLGRWLIAAALAVALLETWLAYRRRSR